MGRKLMRVPMDFDWPIRTVWDGYVNPHIPEECQCCGGSGYSEHANTLMNEWYGKVDGPAHPLTSIFGNSEEHGKLGTFDPDAYGSKRYTRETPGLREIILAKIKHTVRCGVWRRQQDGEISEDAALLEQITEKIFAGVAEKDVLAELDRMIEIWNHSWCHHLIAEDVMALVEEDRLFDFTRRPRTPEQEELLLSVGGYWLPEWNGYVPTPEEVNMWSMQRGVGHDGINAMLCVKARCLRDNEESLCAECGGTGESFANEGEKFDYENWRATEPPTGQGFQLWETTSEGSPISPVFERLDLLCEWLCDFGTVFGESNVSKSEWMRMLGSDDDVISANMTMPNGQSITML